MTNVIYGGASPHMLEMEEPFFPLEHGRPQSPRVRFTIPIVFRFTYVCALTRLIYGKVRNMATDDSTKQLTQEEADTVRKEIEEVEREEAASAAEEIPDKG